MRTRQDILKILDRAEPISEETQTQDLFLEENKPTKPDLWSRAKSAAKKKFNVYPSAYANGWAVKWYNSHGGGWNKVKEDKKTFSQLKNELEEDLGDWFKEKWVDIGGKKDPKTGKYPPCGRGDTSKGKYPKCRPLRKVNKDTPATVATMTDKEKKSAVIQKRRVEPETKHRGTGNKPNKVSHHNLKKKKKD
jgi:hypothetical protein